MRTQRGAPHQLGVAEQALLLGGERCRAVAARPHPVDVEHGHTRHRNERALRHARQPVAKERLRRQPPSDVEARGNGDVEGAGLLTVLVARLAVGVDGYGVGPRAVERQPFGKVVGILDERRQLPLLVVAVGMEEGALDESEEAWSEDGAGGEVLGGTVVAQVAPRLAVGYIEARTEAVGEPYIGIEAQPQAVEVVAPEGALRIHIAQREAVVGHLVASLHADVVLLRQRLAVQVVVPARFVVVLLIEIVVGIVLEELERRLARGRAPNQFRGIEAEGAGVHHAGSVGRPLDACHRAHPDACGHTGAATRLDEDDAARAPDAIERGAVLHDGDALHVGHVDVGKQVVVEAVVQRLAPLLLVEIDTIDNDEGHSVGMQRAEAVDEHHDAVSLHAAAGDGAHLASQPCGHLVVHAHGAARAEVAPRTLRPQAYPIGSTHSRLQADVPGCRHVQQSHRLGDAQRVAARRVRHSGIRGIAVCRHTGTRQSRTRRCVKHHAADATHLLRRPSHEGQHTKEEKQTNRPAQASHSVIL